MSELKELDISYLDTLLGTYESDLDAKLLKSLSDESFTAAMYRAGFLTATTDNDGFITGFEFSPPQNFDMLMTGTSGADNLTAGGGNDIIFSGDGNDVVDGGAGNDMLYGGLGSDTLYGSAGNDTLSGGAGTDSLYGGEGADTFVFTENGALNGLDTIKDFDASQGDVIDISDIITGYDALTDAIGDFVQIIESGSDSFVTIDPDGGADGYQFRIVVENTTGLTDDDFILDNTAQVV